MSQARTTHRLLRYDSKTPEEEITAQQKAYIRTNKDSFSSLIAQARKNRQKKKAASALGANAEPEAQAADVTPMSVDSGTALDSGFDSPVVEPLSPSLFDDDVEMML